MPLSKILPSSVSQPTPVNAIINGNMSCSQRGTSSTGLGGSDGYFTCDRWRYVFNTSGRLTSTQDSSAPSGFANSMKLDCTTADTSIASSEYMFLSQKIEGQNLQHFAKGTSDAKAFSVSFYVKGNASATYVCELYDNDNNRQISKTFSVTTSWSRVELTFPADATGAFGDDNAASLTLSIWLHAGTDYTSGTLNSSAWASNANANRAVSTTSFFDSTNRTFFITGVQLTAGSEHHEFIHETYAETLQKCKRYFHTYGGTNAFEHLPFLGQGNGSSINFNHELPVEMRSTPSLTQSGSWQVNDGYLGGYYTLSSVALDNLSTKLVRGSATTSSAIGGDIGRIIAYNDIDARWSYSAEL